MEPPPELEIIDPRQGRERGFAAIALFLIPAPLLIAVSIACINGRLADRWLGLLFFACVLTSLAGVIYYAVSYWAIVGIDSQGLTASCYQGVIRVPFAAIAKLDWSQGGNLVIRTEDRRRLQPGLIKDRGQRIWFYHQLRIYVPREKQRHWTAFCRQNIKWRDVWQRSGHEPAANEFRMTRRLFDRNWWWVVPVAILDGIGAVFVTGQPESAIVVFGAIVILLLMARAAIPREGVLRPKRRLANWWLPISLGLIQVIGAMFFGIITLMRSGNPELAAWGEHLILILAIVGYSALLAILLAALWLQRRSLTGKQAEESWEKLDEELFGKGANQTS